MTRVLVLDDDVLLRRCMERILRSAGFEPICCETGEEALRLAADHTFDVALVDYHMPGMDGLRVMTQLREIQPSCLRVLVTGRLELPVIKEAVNNGQVSRVVEKPFDTTDLVAAVTESMSQRARMMEVLQVQRQVAAETEQQMLSELLSGPQLRLAVHAMVDARSQDVVAYECLLRSTHPVLDGPLSVLAAAERHGRIGDLGDAVMARARDWVMRLPEHQLLFVNLHPDELHDADDLVRRLDLLEGYAERIVLEITERSRLEGGGWERSLEAATSRGFRIAVDDLGAGYSSLSMLAAVQPSFVKVDMSIVRDVHQDIRKQRLVELLCKFSDATGSTLVAEGVETRLEADTLRDLGAHWLQGYLFARPGFELLHEVRAAV